VDSVALAIESFYYSCENLVNWRIFEFYSPKPYSSSISTTPGDILSQKSVRMPIPIKQGGSGASSSSFSAHQPEDYGYPQQQPQQMGSERSFQNQRSTKSTKVSTKSHSSNPYQLYQKVPSMEYDDRSDEEDVRQSMRSTRTVSVLRYEPNYHARLNSIGENLKGRIGAYVLLFLVRSLLYFAFWIVDVVLLCSGDILVEERSTQIGMFIFTSMNCINFWIVTSWLSTLFLTYLRGANVMQALLNNFGFFFFLLHYLLFSDSLGLALDAAMYEIHSGGRTVHIWWNLLLALLGYLSIIFYPKIYRFFPMEL